MKIIEVSNERGRSILESCRNPLCNGCRQRIVNTNGVWKKYKYNSGHQFGNDLENYWYFYECSCGYQNSLKKLKYS